jgi:two-component system sensor histidine kinase KdpD
LAPQRLQVLRNPVLRYLAAGGLVGVATVVALLSEAMLQPSTLQMLFVLAVFSTALLAGFGPALAASILSFLAVNFFFIEPRHTFNVARSSDIVRLVEFLVAAVLSGSLAAYARAQTARAERRSDEIWAVYQLSQALDATTTITERLECIVRTTAAILHVSSCAIHLIEQGSGAALEATFGRVLPSMRHLALPLQVRHYAEGELQVSVPVGQRDFSADDYHVLRLLMSQIGQSLERAHLADQAAQTQAIRESDRVKTTILSALSHDLRTPLTAIQGAVSELNATDVTWTPALRQTLIDAIGEQTAQLHQLVANLLDVSRIRAGAVTSHKDWYAIEEVIHHSLDSMQSQISQHATEVQCPADLPLIQLDFVLTEQVITNLVLNAATYSPPQTTIHLAITTQPGWVTVAVSDHGPGIPLAVHSQIFEPFYRQTTGPTTTQRGNGLGLAICKGFVEAQGGTIGIDATYGAGTRIWFCLPTDALEERHDG